MSDRRPPAGERGVAPADHRLRGHLRLRPQRERNGDLALVYGEGFPKFMFPLGDHALHTSEAIHVRIRFAVEGEQVKSLTIHDPDLVLAADRVAD